MCNGFTRWLTEAIKAELNICYAALQRPQTGLHLNFKWFSRKKSFRSFFPVCLLCPWTCLDLCVHFHLSNSNETQQRQSARVVQSAAKQHSCDHITNRVHSWAGHNSRAAAASSQQPMNQGMPSPMPSGCRGCWSWAGTRILLTSQGWDFPFPKSAVKLCIQTRWHSTSRTRKKYPNSWSSSSSSKKRNKEFLLSWRLTVG